MSESPEMNLADAQVLYVTDLGKDPLHVIVKYRDMIYDPQLSTSTTVTPISAEDYFRTQKIQSTSKVRIIPGNYYLQHFSNNLALCLRRGMDFSTTKQPTDSIDADVLFPLQNMNDYLESNRD
ncbi:hypothetical protein K2X33_03165 [bacterium]|nr:hypothetical protein [bacterium]